MITNILRKTLLLEMMSN